MVYRGHVEKGVVVLDESTTLPEGAEVKIEVSNAELEVPVLDENGETLGQKLLKHAGKAVGLPPDLAVNHDRYLYGMVEHETDIFRHVILLGLSQSIRPATCGGLPMDFGLFRHVVTTAWVIAELANAMCKAANRPYFLSLLRDLQSDRRIVIVPPTQELFDRGMELFAKRLDKDWSLTDCISFVVMEDHKLHDAATLDHHFAQAGFTIVIPM